MLRVGMSVTELLMPTSSDSQGQSAYRLVKLMAVYTAQGQRESVRNGGEMSNANRSTGT
jgi:hypothetical protein